MARIHPTCYPRFGERLDWEEVEPTGVTASGLRMSALRWKGVIETEKSIVENHNPSLEILSNI
jgi:hypothetical protein